MAENDRRACKTYLCVAPIPRMLSSVLASDLETGVYLRSGSVQVLVG